MLQQQTPKGKSKPAANRPSRTHLFNIHENLKEREAELFQSSSSKDSVFDKTVSESSQNSGDHDESENEGLTV